MRLFISIILILNISVAQSGEIRSPDKHWFYFEVNNHMSPSYSVTLFENEFLFQEFYGDHRVAMNWCTGSVDLNWYSSLSSDLDRIGINDWDDYYINKNVSDGTSYKVIVNIKTRSRHIYGANEYPSNFEMLLTLVNAFIKEKGCESSL